MNLDILEIQKKIEEKRLIFGKKLEEFLLKKIFLFKNFNMVAELGYSQGQDQRRLQFEQKLPHVSNLIEDLVRLSLYEGFDS